MPRPNRLYTIDGKYYYIKDGKKVFVKVPAGVSQKQVSKINIKNIIKLAESKRVVRKKKRRNLSYQKKIAPILDKSETSGLPIYFFKPQKNIPTLEDQAKASDDTNIEKLSKLLLKGITAVPSSSKLPAEPTIVSGIPIPTAIPVVTGIPIPPSPPIPPSAPTTPVPSTTPKKVLTFTQKAKEAFDRVMANRREMAAEREQARLEKAQREQARKEQEAINKGQQIQLKQSKKPNVQGLATTRTQMMIEGVPSPTLSAVKKRYIPEAESNITPGIFEEARKRSRSRFEKYQRENPTPSKVYANPLARQRPMTTPATARNLGESMESAKGMLSPELSRIAKSNIPATQKLNEFVAQSIKEKTEVLGGEGYGSDGLYDDEIETIAKKRLKDYIPCIAKDETQQLLKYVKKGDKQFGFVINTDNSDQPGRHWRCVYINNMDDYPSIEYFDPLTEGKPEQSLIDICRKIAIKMNPEKLFKYKQNMIRRQSKLSSNCGYHCIHFLEGRYMGIPFSEITGYDEFVDKMKKEHGDLDGSGQGESELKPFMKKYNSYI